MKNNCQQLSLLLFTRYPRAGAVKTRLAAALGGDGSALLHRVMSERALATARAFAASSGCRLRVCFTGCDYRDIGRWLGFDLKFSRQSEGDLGQRLSCAVEQEFAAGARGVIVIGSDCPALTETMLQDAAEKLRAGNDLVLGPAADGGYYLIGLSRPEDSLFEGISWGGAEVAKNTLARAGARGLRCSLLPELADVDRPGDLAAWRKMARPRLTIVIPVLNEAGNLPAVLAALRLEKCPGLVEVVVVDGGSEDASVELAEAAGCRVLSSPPGRGRQMNLGARSAKADNLLFLHADTCLDFSAFAEILDLLQAADVVLGAFRIALEAPGRRFRLLEMLINSRSAWLGLPYGDQGLFMRRQDFLALGGFRELPLLEDLDLVLRARRLGRLRLARNRVTTSARRWRRLGFWRTLVINQLVLLGWLFGVSPARLGKLYRGDH